MTVPNPDSPITPITPITPMSPITPMDPMDPTAPTIPEPEIAVYPEVVYPEVKPPKVRKPRKRRTGLLFTSAVVLGLLGGAGAGYSIQQHRKPTSLPVLDAAFPGLKAPAAVGGATTPSANDIANDDEAKINGDLRKLVLDKPAGAKDWDVQPFINGWEGLDTYAQNYPPGVQADYFHLLNSANLRRIAGRAWTTSDGTQVEVEILQFRTSDGPTAVAQGEGGPSNSTPIPGTTTGTVGIFDDKNASDEYTARGSFLHGDLLVQIWVFSSTHAVNAATVLDLTKQQMAKL